MKYSEPMAMTSAGLRDAIFSAVSVLFLIGFSDKSVCDPMHDLRSIILAYLRSETLTFGRPK